MDLRKIEQSLTIDDHNKETIYSIVGRMKILLDIFERNKKYKSLVPFLKTYYLVTKTVAEKALEDKNYFKSFSKMQAIDVHFASLYFKALKSYIMHGESIKPWKRYFDYCKKEDGNPILQIILGINSHINGDLFTTLYDLKYNQKEDFIKINAILEEKIPEIINFLIFEEHSFFTGIEAILFRKLIHKEFKNVIVKWRLDAWDNYKVSNNKNFESNKLNAINKTEDLNKDLINMFHGYPVLKPLETLEDFNSLRVMLIV